MSREENSFDPHQDPLDDFDFSKEEPLQDGVLPDEPLLEVTSNPEALSGEPIPLEAEFGDIQAESFDLGDLGDLGEGLNPLEPVSPEPAAASGDDVSSSLGVDPDAMGGAMESLGSVDGGVESMDMTLGAMDSQPAPVPDPEEGFSSFSFEADAVQPPNPAVEPSALGAEPEFGAPTGPLDLAGTGGDFSLDSSDAGSLGVPAEETLSLGQSLPMEEPSGLVPPSTPSLEAEPVAAEAQAETFELELSRPPTTSDMFGGEMPAAENEAVNPYSTPNRPASGARQARPGEVLSFGFDKSENAGDFLGLDVEFTEGQAHAEPGLAMPQAPMLPETDYEETPFGGEYEAVDPEYTAEYDSAYESEEFEGEEGDPYEFDDEAAEEEYAMEEGRSRRPVGVLLSLILVGGLAGAGYKYGPGLIERYTGGGATEVAKVDPVAPKPAVRPQPRPVVTPGPVDVAPGEGTPAGGATSVADGGRGAGLTPVPDPAPTSVASSVEPPSDTTGSQVPAVDANPSDSLLPTSAGPGDSGLDGLLAGGNSPEGGDTQLNRDASLSAGAFPDLGADSFDWANPGKLDILWRGTDIPEGAIQSPARTIMPQVGDVRVFMTTGEIFEGRLYAVGEGRVWLRTGPGQVGLDGSLVERFQRLGEVADGPTLVEEGLAAGKRVRVEVPGGAMFGRVIKADGAEVVLMTDAGGRVTVASSSVHAIGKGRTFVVHR